MAGGSQNVPVGVPACDLPPGALDDLWSVVSERETTRPENAVSQLQTEKFTRRRDLFRSVPARGLCRDEHLALWDQPAHEIDDLERQLAGPAGLQFAVGLQLVPQAGAIG